MTKIIFIFPTLVDYHAGRVLAADKMFKKEGCEVHLIEVFTYQQVYNHKQEKIISVREHFGRHWHPLSPSMEGGTLKLHEIAAFIKTIWQLKPDIIFVYGYHFLASWITIFLSKFLDIKLVLMTDSKADDGIRNAFKEYVKRQIVKHFHGAFVAGNRHVDYVVSLGIERGAVVTGLDVIDNDQFGAWVSSASSLKYPLKQENEVVFLAVARLVERKGICTLLQAFANVVIDHSTSIQLWIVGEGEQRTSLETAVANLGLIDRVKFLGSRTNEEVASFMAHGDCLVLPSDYDQWGLVVNEAMVAGLPVIVTQTCGCAGELVRSDIEGLVIPPKNVKDLTEAIKKISENPELRTKFKNNCIQRIKLFSLSQWAENAFLISRKLLDLKID